MTGEMSWIKPDGTDSNGMFWPLHAALAKALRCPLRPFDVYIGPYIAHRKGKLWIDEDECSGRIVLWPNGIAPAYQEPIVSEEFFVQDCAEALAAARSILKGASQ